MDNNSTYIIYILYIIFLSLWPLHDDGSLSYTPILLLEPKISEGYFILKIIYSETNYLIKHPVVYFLSIAITSKNSSDIYVIRHIITKIIFSRWNIILVWNKLS